MNRTQVATTDNPLDHNERPLLAAAWVNPPELARVCDAYGLHVDDFRDRLCGVAVGYLRYCADQGRAPDLRGAADDLADFGVPHVLHELYLTLVETPVTPRDSIADLVQAVTRAADERSDSLLRDLCREAWRAMLRGLRLDAEQHAKLHGDDPLSRHSPRNGRDKRRPCERSPLFRVGGST